MQGEKVKVLVTFLDTKKRTSEIYYKRTVARHSFSVRGSEPIGKVVSTRVTGKAL